VPCSGVISCGRVPASHRPAVLCLRVIPQSFPVIAFEILCLNIKEIRSFVKAFLQKYCRGFQKLENSPIQCDKLQNRLTQFTKSVKSR
jgi:hypothetical protein